MHSTVGVKVRPCRSCHDHDNINTYRDERDAIDIIYRSLQADQQRAAITEIYCMRLDEGGVQSRFPGVSGLAITIIFGAWNWVWRGVIDNRGAFVVTQYVAFLRAINISGRFVKMARLRDIFASMDFDDVRTYIQSGNVLFQASESDVGKLEREIEAELEKALGFDVPTLIRTKEDLAEFVATHPLVGRDLTGAIVYVSFLRKAPTSPQREAVLALNSDVHEVHVHGREVLWLTRPSVGRSRVSNTRLERLLKMNATNRNLRTINQLVQTYFSTDAVDSPR